jgi:hypothetical protein
MLLIIATHALQQNSTASAQLILAVLCVVVMSSIALGVCIGLARRMQQIADRTPRTSPPPKPPAADPTNDQAPD